MVALRSAIWFALLFSLHCGGGDGQFRAAMARVKRLTVHSVQDGATACTEIAISRIREAETEEEAAAAHAAGKKNCVVRLSAAYNTAAAAFNGALKAQAALADGSVSEGEAVQAAQDAYRAIVQLRQFMQEMGLANGKRRLFDRAEPLPAFDGGV